MAVECQAIDTCQPERDESVSTSSGFLGKWGAVTASVYRAATDGWLDLPPQQESLPFLRLAAVLLRLSALVYDVDESHVGQTVGLDVPLAGADGDRAPIRATLVDFRAAVPGEGLSSPEQFGLWEVAGVGLVLAFRGTASAEDVLVDVNIRPTALSVSRAMRGVPPLQVHQGFYNGVGRHLSVIKDLVAARAETAPFEPSASQDDPAAECMDIDENSPVGGSRGSNDSGKKSDSGGRSVPTRGSSGGRRKARKQPSPLWLTGHSLGGGYANVIMLHMLASRSTAELFAGGGGSVTFGAPMVLYGEDANKLYAGLQKLEAAAEAAAGRAGHSPLQFHNFVCGSDIVPRLLGASLDKVQDSIADYWQVFGRLTMGMRATSQAYHPFGTYHFILGKEVRTPKHSSAAAAGGIGDASYAGKIARQLDVNAAVKAILRGAASSPAHDHLLRNYELGLRTTMDALAAKAPRDGAEDAAEPVTLFRLTEPESVPQGRTPSGNIIEDEHVEALGRSIGQAGWTVAAAAAGFAGRAAVSYMQQPSTSRAQPDVANAEGEADKSSGSTWGGWFGKPKTSKQTDADEQ